MAKAKSDSGSEFQTLATHLAGKDVQIIFDKSRNAHPHTDGQVITLPARVNRECIYPTIAATLHESHHCKITKFSLVPAELLQKYWMAKRYPSIDRNLFHLIINLFEDIRIDNQVFNNFCNSRELYNTMLSEIMDNKEKVTNLDANTLIFRIMEYTYLRGVDFENLFNHDELLKGLLESENAKNVLDKCIDLAKNMKQTSEATEPGKLFIDFVASILKTEGARKDAKQKAQSKIAANAEQIENLKNKLNEKTESLDSINKKLKKAENKKDNAVNKLFKYEQEWKKDAKNSEKNIYDDKEWKELSKDRYEKLSETGDLKQEARKEQFVADDLSSEINKLNEKNRRLEQNEAEVLSDEIASDGYGYGEGVMGFKNLAKNFKLTQKDDLVMFSENIETIFSRLSQKVHKSESTGKINVKNIYKIFDSKCTNIDDIFTSNMRKRTYDNKLIILMDVSGSMSGKMKMMSSAVSNLLRVIDKNKDAYNIDYAVATYSNDVKYFKKFDQEKVVDYDNFQAQITNEGLVSMGGTYILDSLNKMQNYIDLESDVKDNKYILIFTDAQFGHYDMKVILDKYNAEKEKIIFVGLGKKHYSMNYGDGKMFYDKILMGRMVNDLKKLEKTLLDAFDRVVDRN